MRLQIYVGSVPQWFCVFGEQGKFARAMKLFYGFFGLMFLGGVQAAPGLDVPRED